MEFKVYFLIETDLWPILLLEHHENYALVECVLGRACLWTVVGLGTDNFLLPTTYAEAPNVSLSWPWPWNGNCAAIIHSTRIALKSKFSRPFETAKFVNFSCCLCCNNRETLSNKPQITSREQMVEIASGTEQMCTCGESSQWGAPVKSGLRCDPHDLDGGVRSPILLLLLLLLPLTCLFGTSRTNESKLKPCALRFLHWMWLRNGDAQYCCHRLWCWKTCIMKINHLMIFFRCCLTFAVHGLELWSLLMQADFQVFKGGDPKRSINFPSEPA